MDKHTTTNNTNISFECAENFYIPVEDTIYALTIYKQKDYLSFTVMNQLPYAIYEGYYSLEDLNKIAFFRHYNTIEEMMSELRDSINEKSVSIRAEDKKVIICISYEFKKKLNIDELTLTKQEEVNSHVIVEDLSNIVKDLVSKMKSVVDKNEILVKKSTETDLEQINMKAEFYKMQSTQDKRNEEFCNQIREIKLNLQKKDEELQLIKEECSKGKEEYHQNLQKKDEEIISLNEEINSLLSQVNKLSEDMLSQEVEVENIKIAMSKEINELKDKLIFNESAINNVKNELTNEIIELKKELKRKSDLIESLNFKSDKREEEVSKLMQRITSLEEEEYLRNEKIRLEGEKEEQLRLQKEREEKEKELIEIPYLNPNSLIKSVDEFNQLREWIITSNNNSYSTVKFTLLYDSLVDSDSAKVFHQMCDNKGPTLSIIESEHGLRFGGYSTLTWESPSSDKYKENDPTAFIYSLSKMKNFKCKNQSYVILCNKDFNVVYGGYGDIAIYNNFTTATNNCSNFGVSYDSSGIEDPKTYLAGSYNFKVRKVEVYRVDLQ